MKLMVAISLVFVIGCLSCGALAVPLLEDSLPKAMPNFAEEIMVIQERLENVTAYMDAWLSRQRNRVDDSVGIINTVALSVFANGVEMVQNLRDRTIDQLNARCRDEEIRQDMIASLNANATIVGDTIVLCANLVHDDVDRLIKQQFYTYMHILQEQSVTSKKVILLGFEVFNPVTRPDYIVLVMNDVVDSVNDSFELSLRPEVEEQVREMSDSGQWMVGMATTCAYDVSIGFSQMVHDVIATEC